MCLPTSRPAGDDLRKDQILRADEPGRYSANGMLDLAMHQIPLKIGSGENDVDPW
jgi:hypothetical protein